MRVPREKWGGGNAGLMESEENIKPFPSLPTVLGNPAKNAGLPHSHRTATTIEFGQFYFVPGESFQLCSNRIRSTLWVVPVSLGDVLFLGLG